MAGQSPFRMFPPGRFPPPVDGSMNQNPYLGFMDVSGGVQGAGFDPTAPITPESNSPVLPDPTGSQPVLGAPETPTAPKMEQPQGDESYPSAESIARRQKLAEALLGKQMEVNHPMQAVANAVSQISGAYLQSKAEKDEEKARTRKAEQYKKMFSEGGDAFDLEMVAKQLMNSNDPADVERGIELSMKIAESKRRRTSSGGAPTVKTFWNPDGTAWQGQWVEDENEEQGGRWEKVGEGPRSVRRTGSSGGGTVDGSGGDAGMDDDGSTGSSRDPSILDAETIDYMADQYMAGDRSVFTNLGRGKSGARNVVALRKRVAEKAREIDPATGKPRMSARQVAAAQSELQGYAAFQRTNEVQSARMKTAAQEARNMARDVIETSRSVPRSQYRLINRVGNEYRAQTNDPNLAQFVAALNSFVNTYSRAISPTGQPTVSDKEEARKVLDTAMSQDSVEATMRILDREMQNAIAAPDQTRRERSEQFYDNNRAGEEPAHGPINPPEAEPKKAASKAVLPPKDKRIVGKTEYKAPNGQTYVWGRDASGKVGWIPR